MKKKILKGFTWVLVCLVISVVGLVGGFKTTQSVLAITESRFEQLELFNKILFLIESQYYRKVDTNKLIEGAIKGMMETLDPHSNFLPPDVFEKMQNDTNGEFGGLGIEVSQKDGVIYVISAMDDSPAHKKGLKSGDKIVEIDHEPIIGIDLEKAVEKMRGKPGSKIILGIMRVGAKEVQYITFEREVIKTKPVKAELVKDNYAFIRLTSFQQRSAAEIVAALKKLSSSAEKKGGIKAIILDLRFNPGGLLDQAVEVSSLFLEEGVVVSTEGRDPKNKDIRYVIKSGFKDTTTPLVVLINGASASASEIVAGALQDYRRGIIMGSQSFGKGSVQTVAKVDKNNGVKLTIAQYLTPNNRRIQAVGIKPDIELDEMDANWVQGHHKESFYIREKDLRNHLTATVETEEEEKARIQEDKLEREERAKRVQEQKQEKKMETTEEGDFRKYVAAEDFQVIQAINYIRGLAVLKKNNL